MANIKQIGMAAGTFSVALGIGFVMQNGDALASRFGSDTEVQQPAPFTADVDVSQVAVEPEAIAPEADAAFAQPVDEAPVELAQSAVLPSKAPVIEAPEAVVSSAVILPESAKVPPQQDAPVQLANLDPELDPEVAIDADVAAPVLADVDCVPLMEAAGGAAATVTLSVMAPCHTDAAFTIHHQGMMFTASTDATGAAEVTVPALAEVAVMIAAFENGDGAVATTTIEDFAAYDRAVLQWQGDTSVMLSAYEGDAVFGSPNHIHADNPGDMARVAAAEGGYLVRLGDGSVDDALMAEVYTFPTGMMGTGPDVFLVAEAEITAANCGQELNAQSIQVSPTGATSALDLTMVMPACDAVGDFLILQNMFEDLTLASR